MNFLICESNPKLWGDHASKLKDFFQDANFSYVQNFSELIDQVKPNAYYYDFIFCNESQENKMSGEDIYKVIRALNISSSVILVSDGELEMKENIEDNFFCLNQSYGTKELKNILNIISAKVTS